MATPQGTLLPGVERSLADAVRSFAPVMAELAPDIVVGDVLTPAPVLAAEMAGVPRATLMPIPYPPGCPGLPDFELGLLPPRTAIGRGIWRAIEPLMLPMLPRHRWLGEGLGGLNSVRMDLELPALERDDGSVTEGLTMVATLPQLEYPRRWPPSVHVTGPMIFDPPHPDVSLPAGDRPLVFVASSTERDPDLRLVQVGVEALKDEPVRIVAATGRRDSTWSLAGDGDVVADWVPYSQVMPRADLVIGQGGQGTLARALCEGVPVLVCPDAPDMAGNGARIAWAGVGLMLPKRLLGTRALRWAVRRLIDDPRFATRAGEIAAWSRSHDGAAVGARLVERHATSPGAGAS